MEANTEKREAVVLTNEEATARFLEAFNKLHSEIERIVALTYVEGMAAANDTRPPRATA